MLFFKNSKDAPVTSEYPRSGGVGFIIAGLGNPGLQYENTRHNAGFLALDTLAEQLGIRKLKKLKFKSLTETADIDGDRVLLMKPTTFMNLSGEAVTEEAPVTKPPYLLSII